MANNIHFDFLAPLYDRVIAPPEPNRLKRILDLPTGGWLLDAAGGTGRVASLLCPMVENLVVSDLSRPMLAQITQKKGEKTRCLAPIQARVERLPFTDGFFARILVVDAFHHFSDQAGALAEFHRLLAPGGRLVIEEPDIRQFRVKLIALAERLALMDSHFRDPEEIRATVSRLGLDASIEVQDYAAWIIAIKPLKTGGHVDRHP